MARPADRSLSSESGFIGVGAVIGLAIVGIGVYLLLAAFSADSDYYGTVPVPSSQAPIELDGGDAEVSYAEEVATGSLDVPEDLAFAVRTAEGEVLESSSRNGSPEESDRGSSELISAVDVPEDGTYYVSAESGQASTRLGAELAFGLSPTGAVQVRFGEVTDALAGPIGIAALVVLAALFLIPRLLFANRQRKRRRERPDIYY